MDIIREKININEFRSRVFDMYFRGMSFAAFDIETTGLQPGNSQMMLAGFCSCRDGVGEIVQFYAESLSEEADVIEASLSHMKDLDFVLTYNGRRFDTPFTLKRAGMCRIPKKLTSCYPYDFDLYPLVRKFSDIGSFTPNLRQTTLENFMGLWQSRTDEIDGGISVDMYYDYLVSRDPELKKKILLHNRDDVVQLYRLLGATGRIDMHAGLSKQGFPVKTSKGVFIIDSALLKRNKLVICGRQGADHVSYQDPGDGYLAAKFDKAGSFQIEITLMQRGDLMLADITKLPADEWHFEGSPAFGSGYLVLAQGTGKTRQCNHMEINLLAKIITERIVENEL